MMRDHNDNTKLDMISDIGAGRWKNAFRERPLTWHGPGEDNKAVYINERTIGTQQTGAHRRLQGILGSLSSGIPSSLDPMSKKPHSMRHPVLWRLAKIPVLEISIGASTKPAQPITTIIVRWYVRRVTTVCITASIHSSGNGTRLIPI